MTATGSKAARRSPKIGRAIWRFCAGRRLRRTPAPPEVQSPSSPPLSPEPGPTVDTRDPLSHGSLAPGRKLLIFTDAWAPQVNGVVRTLETLGWDLRSRGWQVRYAKIG